LNDPSPLDTTHITANAERRLTYCKSFKINKTKQNITNITNVDEMLIDITQNNSIDHSMKTRNNLSKTITPARIISNGKILHTQNSNILNTTGSKILNTTGSIKILNILNTSTNKTLKSSKTILTNNNHNKNILNTSYSTSKLSKFNKSKTIPNNVKSVKKLLTKDSSNYIKVTAENGINSSELDKGEEDEYNSGFEMADNSDLQNSRIIFSESPIPTHLANSRINKILSNMYVY